MLSRPDFVEKQVVLALLSHGDKLSFKNDNIIISDKDKNIKHQSSCYRLFSLFVVGNITITSGLLQRAKKFGFSIVLLSHNLKPYSFWNASAEGNTLLRKKQYGYSSQDIAKRLVHNKIHNQIQVLKNIRYKEDNFKKNIRLISNYKNSIKSSQKMELEKVLGIEGVSSKLYFQCLFKDHQWKARRPRVKMDSINCLLDIGYTLLFNFMESLTHLYGFDVYQGVYHKQFYKRKSLICDLVEPFRPLIDSRVRKAYRLNQIKKEDFYVSQGQYFLFGKKSLPYMKIFIETLISNKESIFQYVQSYYRAFIRNAPIENYPYFDISQEEKKAC